MKVKRVVLAFAALVIVLGLLRATTVVEASANVPRVVGSASLTGQTTNNASVLSVTVPSGGANYRITVSDIVTTSGTPGGTFLIDYTSDLGAVEPAASFTSAWTTHAPFDIHAASGTVVISTAGTQDGGAQTYNLYVTIEEL